MVNSQWKNLSITVNYAAPAYRSADYASVDYKLLTVAYQLPTN